MGDVVELKLYKPSPLMSAGLNLLKEPFEKGAFATLEEVLDEAEPADYDQLVKALERETPDNRFGLLDTIDCCAEAAIVEMANGMPAEALLVSAPVRVQSDTPITGLDRETRAFVATSLLRNGLINDAIKVAVVPWLGTPAGRLENPVERRRLLLDLIEPIREFDEGCEPALTIPAQDNEPSDPDGEVIRYLTFALCSTESPIDMLVEQWEAQETVQQVVAWSKEMGQMLKDKAGYRGATVFGPTVYSKAGAKAALAKGVALINAMMRRSQVSPDQCELAMQIHGDVEQGTGVLNLYWIHGDALLARDALALPVMRDGQLTARLLHMLNSSAQLAMKGQSSIPLP